MDKSKPLKSVSVLRESKLDYKGRECENRIILTPELVQKLKESCPKTQIFIEDKAGEKIDIPNSAYEVIGAKIVSHHEALRKDLILGVKETKIEDFYKLGKSIWLSYQHFAQSEKRTKLALITSEKQGTTFITLETIEEKKNGKSFFPCLAPMSEAAGRIIARHADMWALICKRIITSGLSSTGMKKAKVTILGPGTVGCTAEQEFQARGMEVHLIGRDELPQLKSSISGSLFAISAMYTAGKKPEKLITAEMLKSMIPGGCVYPVDIDQGGGIEGAIETSILDPFDLPTIEGTDINCFAPPNIPSMGARTTSVALGAAILPYVIDIINLGLEEAAKKNVAIQSGINIKEGKIVHEGLASVFQ